MQISKTLIMGLVLALSPTVALAGLQIPKSNSRFVADLPADGELGEFDAGVQKELAAAAKASSVRKIASANFSDSDLSAEFKTFRAQFLKIQSAEELDALLLDLDSKYDALPLDMQFFAAQMQILRVFRGIVWRLTPIFAQDIFGSRMTQSQVVTSLQRTAASLRIYLPTDQWQAGFEYITAPAPTFTSQMKFNTVEDVQNYMTSVGVSALSRAAKRIKAIWKQNPSRPFVWDNTIAYGSGTFDDGLNRYIGHGMPEVEAALGSLHGAIHSLYVFSAYDLNQLPSVATDLGKLAGIDGFAVIGGDVGVTSQDRNRVIAKYRSKGFLALRKSEGQSVGKLLMKAALPRLRDSVSYFHSAFQRLQGQAPNRSVGLNPMGFQQDQYPLLKSGVDNMLAVVAERTRLRSPVTGETIQVDVPAFYKNPPESLLVFSPTAFEGGPKVLSISGKKEKLEYRNYSRGRAIAWETSRWVPYLPSAEGQGPNYPASAARILRFTPGMAQVAAFVGSFAQ